MTKAERTRQLIIEKTAPIFNQKGYAGTSLNDISEATGLTRGGIYGNFENKDEVALAAFDYNYGQFFGVIRGRIKEKSKAHEKLQVYINAYRHPELQAVLQYGCPILNTATESDDTHPELRKRVIAAINRWHRGIEDIVKEGQERKEFRKSVDVKEFASVFIALIEGGVMLVKATGNDSHIEAALRHAKKMIQEIRK
ncbi:transcriptional regulator [Flavobacterium akiainvivens]|uniref:Transcriptional regulator n=1 Tax=Flavobacterium akiainvivens TaxID=1202724 RepID=A0A0M8MBJ4_9FLAO|nr:TetR family transcriptional regulator [Flavobacterium akiainvivens]KOS06665.1 transcriptional regulator [Flavobacterium akiainvivens]SFQ70632.1 transcriptional regulator, TetR family [Flavobacterium akiainvivens]